MLRGACHCGWVTVAFDTALTPAELPVRECGCSFCVRHRPRYTSDPKGHLRIEAERASVVLYRFGLFLADFVLCARCGVFVAAHESRDLAVLNSVVLDRAAELTAAPTAFTAYDDEDADARTARRARAWTPTTLILR